MGWDRRTSGLLICVLLCLGMLLSAGSARADGSLSDLLRKQPKAADAGQALALRIADGSGQLRWQIPAVLWVSPRAELGGFLYPAGLTPDRPLFVRGPLVYVGYGLTREGWDDYQGKRIDGGIAVVCTGTPQLKPPVDRADPADFETWTRLVQEKVRNAQGHGAVAVWLERSPLAPGDAGDRNQFLKRAATMWGPVVNGPLPIPVFTTGSSTLAILIGLSTDLFEGDQTIGDYGPLLLLKEAEEKGKGLGPIPLALAGELSWSGARLERKEGSRCTIWYQPGTRGARDAGAIAKACDGALHDLETLLSVRLEERPTVLLFGDWRSKLATIQHLGEGFSTDSRYALVYKGDEDVQGTLVHETCHVVAGKLGSPPACFDEGLGRLMGDTRADPKAVQSGQLAADEETAENLRAGKLWSLRELLLLPDIGSTETKPGIAYPEAASFSAFLIRRFGFETYRKLYQALKPGDLTRIAVQLQEATGRSLDQLEADWHAYLREARK